MPKLILSRKRIVSLRASVYFEQVSECILLSISYVNSVLFSIILLKILSIQFLCLIKGEPECSFQCGCNDFEYPLLLGRLVLAFAITNCKVYQHFRVILMVLLIARPANVG